MTALTERTAHRLVWLAAICFGMVIFVCSAWRWWTFRYGTFDLAFYVQALWLALHGKWQVSLLEVPLMGNHAEPIVFLALPLFAVCPHPMLLVGLQTVALASLPLTAWRVARHLGLAAMEALPLALAVVLIPATAFIGLHEFHPEAFAAPLLLLVAEARLKERRGLFWLWWLLALGTKENVALLLVAWAVVNAWTDRRKSAAEQWRWNAAPGLAAVAWLVLYGAVISPALNGGKVDYLELYSHLGHSGGEIVGGFFTQPSRALGALQKSLSGGDLLWATLLPLLLLPLFSPRWLVIAAPALLQHLLSWRSSEWSIRFHYAAPLVPLFWLGAATTLSRVPWVRWKTIGSWSVLAACYAAQLGWGAATELVDELTDYPQRAFTRKWKAEALRVVEADPAASVTACHPYLSHLATRPTLYSLHHILKGLRTLSRQRYEAPSATDYVIIDATDESTFSVPSGFYHPIMRTVDGEIVPSSEQLLHGFLVTEKWDSRPMNSLNVLHRIGHRQSADSIPDSPGDVARINSASINSASSEVRPDGVTIDISTNWSFASPRRQFRWLKLTASGRSIEYEIIRGPVAPETDAVSAEEHWTVRLPRFPGTFFQMNLTVFDQLGDTWPTAGRPTRRSADQIFPLGIYRWGSGGFEEIKPGMVR